MNTLRFASALVLALAMTGCATPSKYEWGNYDRSLYNYYKDPAVSDKHMTELAFIVESAGKSNAKVAPGLHAEYGYFLLQNGKTNEARKQFEMEKAAWPESSQLMTILISLTEGKNSNKVSEQTK